MTSYGDIFYLYMRHERDLAGLRAMNTRDDDFSIIDYPEFQFSEFKRYKKQMVKWRLRIKNSRVIKKLGCYNCSYFYIPKIEAIKCNEGHIHLPKITCDDFKPNKLSIKQRTSIVKVDESWWGRRFG